MVISLIIKISILVLIYLLEDGFFLTPDNDPTQNVVSPKEKY